MKTNAVVYAITTYAAYWAPDVLMRLLRPHRGRSATALVDTTYPKCAATTDKSTIPNAAAGLVRDSAEPAHVVVWKVEFGCDSPTARVVWVRRAGRQRGRWVDGVTIDDVVRLLTQ